MDALLNRERLPHNTCFGCGLENPAGLHLRVSRDRDRPDVLRGTLQPRDDMAGFPGIVHGGVIYTALDCLSTWVATILGPNPRAGWILRGATSKYLRPAPIGRSLSLEGRILEQGGPWDPLLVHTEARREDGEICTEADFKVIPLPPDRLSEIAGLTELPENWRILLSGDA